jgi:hypothetical protein
MRSQVDGSETTEIATGQAQPLGLAVVGEDLFWVNRGTDGGEGYVPDSGNLMTAKVDGTGVAKVVTDLNMPSTVAADESFVYWTTFHSSVATNDGTIVRMDRRTGTIEVLARDQAGPRSLAVQRGTVFWINWGHTNSLDADRVGGEVAQWSPTTRTVTTIAADEPAPLALFVDDSDVYWGTQNGDRGVATLRRAPRIGGAPESVATRAGRLTGISSDETSLFVCEANSFPNSVGSILQFGLAPTEAL